MSTTDELAQMLQEHVSDAQPGSTYFLFVEHPDGTIGASLVRVDGGEIIDGNSFAGCALLELANCLTAAQPEVNPQAHNRGDDAN